MTPTWEQHTQVSTRAAWEGPGFWWEESPLYKLRLHHGIGWWQQMDHPRTPESNRLLSHPESEKMSLQNENMNNFSNLHKWVEEWGGRYQSENHHHHHVAGLLWNVAFILTRPKDSTDCQYSCLMHPFAQGVSNILCPPPYAGHNADFQSVFPQCSGFVGF